jgi:hypothetical protein
MDVPVPIRELVVELVGTAIDVFRPPSTDVVDRVEDFFGGSVH